MTDPRETVTLGYAEPVHGAVQGQAPVRVHPRAQCEGRGIPCCIHDPSPHHMRDWPMLWRADTGVMERTCPHGTGHPDPDHLAWVTSLTPEHACPGKMLTGEARENIRASIRWDALCRYPHLEWQAVHGCCGCCEPPGEKETKKGP